MYDNIGGKIKGLAKAAFWVEAITAIITGICLFDDVMPGILIGLLLIIGGPLVAWVSCWLLYGFGELIDSNVEIKNKISNMSAPSQQVDDELPEL